MATRAYESQEKKDRLVLDFRRVDHFLTKQAAQSQAQNLTDYAKMCKEGAGAARQIADTMAYIGTHNPVSMFTNSATRQGDLVKIVEALNPILGLDKDSPLRADPTIRTTMRRLQDFMEWMYDDGNCAKKVVVKEFNLNASPAVRQVPALALGLLQPDKESPQSERAPRPQGQAAVLA